MMEDAWLCIDEDSSSNCSVFDSDVIDSETEAQLYSVIHYEENLSSFNSNSHEAKNVQASELPIQTSNKMNDILYYKNPDKSEQTEYVCTLNPISRNGSNFTDMKDLPSETVFLSKLAQKLNAEKRRSCSDQMTSDDFISHYSEDVNFNQSLKNTSLKNKRKKTDHYLPKTLNSVQKNCQMSGDSSDDDSAIWTEVDSTYKKDLQTNLYKDEDVVCLSSDSESDILMSSKKNELNLKNISMPNIKIAENSKDIWFINDQDLRRQKKNRSRRYHDDLDITCSNCYRRGHNARICPMPKVMKCFICGGGHPGSVCENRICGQCYNFGHDRRHCFMPCLSYCSLCSMKGHIKENCPDLWRRYHLTTQPGKIVQGKQPKEEKLPYCWNCGKKGHFGAVCDEYQGYRQIVPTWPYVVSYDNPDNLLKKRLNSYGGRCMGCIAENANVNKRNRSNAVAKLIAAKRNRKKRIKLEAQQRNAIKVEREKNFPRTPKTKVLSSLSNDAVTDVDLRKQKRRRRNRLRRLRQRQQMAS